MKFVRFGELLLDRRRWHLSRRFDQFCVRTEPN